MAVDKNMNEALEKPRNTEFVYRHLGAALIVAAVVFSASLFGILTRPFDFLAAFWPANAILLGLMVRCPNMATPTGWLAALVGYLSADFLTGGGLEMTLWMTAANMSGVLTGCYLFSRLDPADRKLLRPQSVLYMFSICVVMAACSGAVGGGITPVYFGHEVSTGVLLWFSTELVNSLVVLPIMLTAPVWALAALNPARSIRRWTVEWRRGLPIVALILSLAASFSIGGPGAIAFPVPALLWCALSYSLFSTVLLTGAVSTVYLIAVAFSLDATNTGTDIASTVSIRLGVTFLVLGPIMVASINSAREELLRTLDHAANHDALTGCLLRTPFMARSEVRIAQQKQRGMSVAMLMLDIDHFKSINDRYGHPMGDQALMAFAAAIKPLLRKRDLLGRLGGEEFAVLMSGVTYEETMSIAQRLCDEVQKQLITLEVGDTISITVSIGVCWQPKASMTLRQMLISSDQALYQAKSTGRNKVVSL
ncbi:GGDEF domain-containing protein [Pseudomonas sp. TTU2014-080ASC]|uniref:GGDEF domain-containing protein n=1 Tax=Pseudomonas sp. TTU2014-080ASC TaxID=1729724 RepID=UPI0009E93C09|nr:GGDEF domain-containing protein [Pseudomonas sp. TTU2014-080ASC]